jgi:hypothetical protein
MSALKKLWKNIGLDYGGAGLVKMTFPRDRIEATTQFFRHPDLLERKLIAYLQTADLPRNPKILFAPCSVGCEPYTFVIAAMQAGLYDRYPGMRVYGLDLHRDLLRIARAGAYPVEYFTAGLEHMEDYAHAKNWFFRIAENDGEGHGMAVLSDAVRAKVTFLPAQDVLAHEGRYDITVSLHLMRHLDDSQGLELLGRLLRMSRLTCVNRTLEDIAPQTLQAAFAKVSPRAVFSPLDRDMRILPGRTWRAPAREREAFFRHPTSADEMLVYRHSS